VNRATVLVEHIGQTWVAHRDDGHDCAADPPAPHGVADSITGAVRALVRSEPKETR
jgi:hypothetical protein